MSHGHISSFQFYLKIKQMLSWSEIAYGVKGNMNYSEVIV